jgi:small subunit ribosomal protein S2
MITDTAKIQQLLDAGVHFGYSKTRRHPSAKPYIFTTKNGIDIFDINKVDEMLSKAETFMKECAVEKKVILFVGVKPEAKAATKEIAAALSMPYVTNRWIGGTLTNFKEIKRRVDRLEELTKAEETGDLAKYTKKERLLLNRDAEKLDKTFGGLIGMTKKPDVIVIVDSKREHIAEMEAKRTGVPIISISSSDNNIAGIDYPIVANDGSKSSVSYIIKRLEEAYKSAL